MEKSLTVVVPAYNEEANIEATLATIADVIGDLGGKFEVIVVDDGSTDRTAERVRGVLPRYPFVRLLEHVQNQGFGAAFRTGILNAKMDYCMMVDGDNASPAASLRAILSEVGSADLIIPHLHDLYRDNLPRRLVSRLYVAVLNTACGHSLKYYNGASIYPTEAVRALKLPDGFGFAAHIVVTLLNRGYSFKQIPVTNRNRTEGKSKAFRPKNVISVVRTVMRLAVVESRFKRRSPR